MAAAFHWIGRAPETPRSAATDDATVATSSPGAGRAPASVPSPVPSGGSLQARAEAQKKATFAKFEGVYGKGGPVTELFEWAILGQRMDRGTADFAEKRRSTLAALERDPKGAMERLRAGQKGIPPEWGAMRTAMLNLVMNLDVPKEEKVEYLSGEIARPVRLADSAGQASADSLAVTVAADFLSKVGSEADARRILERYRDQRSAYSKSEIDFVLERVAVHYPELVRKMRPEFGG
jgi:hypothetical protein